MTSPHTPNKTEALVQALNHLHDRALDLATANPTTSHDSANYFGFAMGEYQWIVPAYVFCELVVEPNLAPIPNASALLMGLYNNRGNLVPVFQLHSLISAPPPDIMRVLLLGRGVRSIGLLIDSLPISLEIDQERYRDQPEETPGELQKRLCKGHVSHQGMKWHQLDSSQLGKQLLALSQEPDIKITYPDA